MPSAANKLEKEKESSMTTTTTTTSSTSNATTTTTQNLNDNNNAKETPLRQALTIIEHKIRNLEKRKTKLESYRAIQASGKELSNDQKAAVAKFDEVAQSLEFARDLSKQMTQLAVSSEKEEKKKARKEAIIRAQAETAKIREVLTIQNILFLFSNEQVREDFLNGQNGACKFDENDLNILEKFYIDTQVKRPESSEDQDFQVATQKAAEHLSFAIDGRQKSYGDTTYECVKQIFIRIQESNYLEQFGQENDADDEIENNEAEICNELVTTEENPETASAEIPMEDIIDESVEVQKHSNVDNQLANIITSIPEVTNIQKQPHDLPAAPSAAAVPAPAFPQQPQILDPRQSSQQIQLQNSLQNQSQNVAPVQGVVSGQVQQAAPTALHFPPTTVRAVEQAYFKQHQYMQQMRPLAEVIGGANFFFLQDSELDSPDMVPTGIPGYPTPIPSSQALPQIAPTVQTNNNVEISNSPQPQHQQIPGLQQPNNQHQQKSSQPPQHQPSQQLLTSQAIQTQTFTNQSLNQPFPPIVPPASQPKQQALFSPTLNNQLSQQQPQQNQQTNQGPSGVMMSADLKTQQPPLNSAMPQQQLQPVFSSLPPQIIPPALHHSIHNSIHQPAGTGNIATPNGATPSLIPQMTDAQAAAAAAMVLQQQQQQKLLATGTPPLSGPTPSQQQQLPGYNAGNNASFNSSNNTNKFTTMTQSTQQQPQQITGLTTANLSTIIQQSTEKYESIMEKTKNLDISKERTQPKEASIGEWEPSAEKLRHRDHHHQQQQQKLLNNHEGQTESNQWSNEMHTSSQQQQQQQPAQSNNSNSNKNEWTFDSGESNHWNSGNNESNYSRNRSQFSNSARTTDRNGNAGRIDRSGSATDRIRPSNSSGPPPPNGGYRSRSNYNPNSQPPTSQSNQQNTNRNSGGSTSYFRNNNDSYYQNGNNGGNNSGYNKDNRYSGGSDNRYRTGSRGPQNQLPPRMMSNNPRGGGANGSRPSTGYTRRPQDVNV